MRKLLIVLSLFTVSLGLSAQTIDDLVSEGIKLHDKGKYQDALDKYDEALKLDPSNSTVLFEKSYSLMMLKKYDEATDLLKKVLKESKDPEIRRLSYINYGTILDYQGEGKKSIKKYDEGIKEFPDSYLLWFNKGITQNALKDNDDALESFKKSVSLNPMHASSHNALAQMNNSSRIKAMMSLFAFLLIEPKGSRAEANLEEFNKQLMKGVEKKDGQNINIFIDASTLDKKNKSAEDDFSSQEMLWSVISAANLPDSIGAKSDVDRLDVTMQLFCNTMESSIKENSKGFYKTFYVPMFVELKKKEYVLTACHIALASTNDSDNKEWLNKNQDKITEFYEWLKNYKWKIPD